MQSTTERELKLVTTMHADTAMAGRRPTASKTVDYSAEDVLNAVTASLEDSKAEDLTTIDIRGKSALGDYMIVASGRSHRHVAAISDHLLRALKDHGYGPVRVEGQQAADWVLIDTGDIIVHIFRPEVRDFYAIEKMWTMPDAGPDARPGAKPGARLDSLPRPGGVSGGRH